MPVLKHAKKKLRQDKVRTERNKKVKELYKKLVKEAKVSKKQDDLSKAFSSIDKATKHHILPKNRAARIKSALSKVVDGTASNAAEKEVKKATSTSNVADASVAKVNTAKKATKKAAPKKK